MKTIKDIFTVLGNYILNALAITLLALIYIPNLIAQIIANKGKKATLKVTAEMQFKDAYEIDVFGAVIYQELFNLTLIKSTGTLFGTILNKTVSWYLAKNKEDDKLTFTGKFLYYTILIFDFTSWFSGGHFKFYQNNKQ